MIVSVETKLEIVLQLNTKFAQF